MEKEEQLEAMVKAILSLSVSIQTLTDLVKENKETLNLIIASLETLEHDMSQAEDTIPIETNPRLQIKVNTWVTSKLNN